MSGAPLVHEDLQLRCRPIPFCCLLIRYIRYLLHPHEANAAFAATERKI